MPTPEDRMNRREHPMQAIAVFSFVCLIISLALGIVTASKTLDSASDIRANTARIYRARDQALLAQRRVQAVERHSRNRYKRSSGLARRSNRVAKQAVRTTERVVTVLRDGGYPVPGAPGRRGKQGTAGAQGAAGARGAAGVSAGPFTFEFSFADGQGVLQTRRCTVDPTIGPTVTQACDTPPTGENSCPYTHLRSRGQGSTPPRPSKTE